jgi:hypothetical protein
MIRSMISGCAATRFALSLTMIAMFAACFDAQAAGLPRAPATVQPIGQLSITAPAQASTAAGTISISGSAPGFLNVEVSFNGSLLGRTTPSASGGFSVSVNTLTLPQGPQTLVINAWNSPAGQPYTVTNQVHLMLQVANGSAVPTPALTITSPIQDSTVAGTTTISGSAPGFLNVEVSFNGILLGRATPLASGAFSVSAKTVTLPDGPQKLVINAWNGSAGQPYTVTNQASLTLQVANGSVSITDFGAVADGTTDNIAAITKAIAAAKAKGVAVAVPAGTFAYSNLITLTGVKMFGVGDTSILHALDWSREAIFMYGNGSEVRQLKLTGVQAPARQAAWQTTRITLFGATNFVIDHVTIEGSAAAGIQTAQSASNGDISNCNITNTLSDSIHLTDKASYITLENNHIEYSGDDGIAVVSYLYDGDYVSNITATDNVVLNNKNGRTMSVVGGKNVLYKNNELEGNLGAACLYLAQEGSYNTFGLENVTAEFNTLKTCGNAAIGHGAVMLFTNGSGQNHNVQLIRNDIIQTGTGNPGIRVFGSNTAIVLDSNKVIDGVPNYDVESPGVSLIPYSSGTVGYTPVPVSPIP